MARNNHTLTIPKWAGEAIPRSARPVKDLLKSIAFLRMKEYERQTESFRNRYKTTFRAFEKKIKSRKREDFDAWDDYIIWKGLEAAYEKWRNRYKGS